MDLGVRQLSKQEIPNLFWGLLRATCQFHCTRNYEEKHCSLDEKASVEMTGISCLRTVLKNILEYNRGELQGKTET